MSLTIVKDLTTTLLTPPEIRVENGTIVAEYGSFNCQFRYTMDDIIYSWLLQKPKLTEAEAALLEVYKGLANE